MGNLKFWSIKVGPDYEANVTFFFLFFLVLLFSWIRTFFLIVFSWASGSQLPFDGYEVVGNLEFLNSEVGNGGKKVICRRLPFQPFRSHQCSFFNAGTEQRLT